MTNTVVRLRALNKDVGDAPGLRAVVKELKFELMQDESGKFFVPLLMDAADEIERLERDNAALQSKWDDMQQGFVEVFGEPILDAIELLGATERLRASSDEMERLRAALKAAAYALFQIKRMVPEAIAEHAKQAYDKASAVLDGDADEPRAVLGVGVDAETDGTLRPSMKSDGAPNV